MSSIPLPLRRNCDSVLNQQGRAILELVHTFNLKILNGRSNGDPLGNFTYNNVNLGASTIDYSICSQNFYDNINNFMVLPRNEISDHCKIITELKEGTKSETPVNDDYNWETLQNKFIWDDTLKATFNQILGNELDRMNDIKQRIEAGLIGSTGEMIQELFVQAAKKVINQKQGKTNKDQHKRRKRA